MNLSSVLSRNGQEYQVERNGKIVSRVVGMNNRESHTFKAYIGFLPGTDVNPGDWLINPASERLYIYDVLTMFVSGSPFQLKCYYQTQQEHLAVKRENTVFNIENVHGSIIGNNNITTIHYSDSIKEIRESCNSISDAQDRASIERIASLLEMIVNNQVPVSKGIFSKFSDIMEKYSWLTGSITSAVMNWLMSGNL